MQEFLLFLNILPVMFVIVCLFRQTGCFTTQGKKQAQPVLPPHQVIPQPCYSYQNSDEYWPSAVIATGVQCV